MSQNHLATRCAYITFDGGGFDQTLRVIMAGGQIKIKLNRAYPENSQPL